jgi:hypothetical protein
MNASDLAASAGSAVILDWVTILLDRAKNPFRPAALQMLQRSSYELSRSLTSSIDHSNDKLCVTRRAMSSSIRKVNIWRQLAATFYDSRTGSIFGPLLSWNDAPLRKRRVGLI